jgi:pyruvate/2-oxoacid:ferredoxin oxidoreductase alpha subunit
MIKLRTFSPFPAERNREGCKGTKSPCIMDKSDCFSGKTGVLWGQMVGRTLYNDATQNSTCNYLYGLGGGDVKLIFL